MKDTTYLDKACTLWEALFWGGRGNG